RVADPDLPRELPEHEHRRRVGRLEVPVSVPGIPQRRRPRRRVADRQRVERRHDVPVPRVFGEVPELAIRVEQQVLSPSVGDIVDRDLTNLETDDLALDVEQLASRAEGNERLLADGLGVSLQDGDAGIRRVENRAAALAYDVDRMAESANSGGGSAVGTVDGADADRPATLRFRHVTTPRTCGRSAAA